MDEEIVLVTVEAIRCRSHEAMGRIRGDLKERTFQFAVRVLDLMDTLPNNSKGWEIGRQIIRSATSIGANVREADHAFTDADFSHKCSIARKEAAETHYWLEICKAARLLSDQKLEEAIHESDELVRILVAIVRSTGTLLQERHGAHSLNQCAKSNESI